MPNESPVVTVIIPSFNHAQFIKETILSVINQDYKKIELLIIDDGSSDASVEVIQRLSELCHARFVRFETRYRENKGLCATLNEALDWSRGKYFAPIASDDVLLQHKTSFLVEKLETTNHNAAFGVMREIGAIVNNKMKLNRVLTHTFSDLMRHINMPNAPGAMILTSKLKEIGGYPENIKIEDWYMWLKLTEKGEVLRTYPEEVALYRRHEDNTSSKLWLMHTNRVKVLSFFSDSKDYKIALSKINVLFFRDVVNANQSSLCKEASLEYKRLYDKVSEQVLALAEKHSNIAVYGFGTIGNIIINILGRDCLVFDKSTALHNADKNIFPPEHLINYQIDRLVLASVGYEDKVIAKLIANNLIARKKIVQLDFL